MLTDTQWNIINAVFREVKQYPALTDQQRYGVAERWRPIDKRGGDCEDYALKSIELMIQKGIDPNTIMLITCWTPGGEYHAVAAVTDEYKGQYGTWILDNLQSKVCSQNDLKRHGYRWDRAVGSNGQWVSVS